jgi:thiamine-phosphate pyrophosphorylase
VTDRRAVRGPLAKAVAAAVAAGVDWVQIRERELDGADLIGLAEDVAVAARAGAAARGGEVKVLVNRRLDVALALPAAGAHLGFDAVPPRAARELLGAGALLGAAAHSAWEALAAPRLGLDYVHLAPVFPPVSKSGGRPPLGIHALREASRATLPVLAQGGIDASNAAAAAAGGAAGVAVTGAILLADDPGRAAAALRSALDA